MGVGSEPGEAPAAIPSTHPRRRHAGWSALSGPPRLYPRHPEQCLLGTVPAVRSPGVTGPADVGPCPAAARRAPVRPRESARRDGASTAEGAVLLGAVTARAAAWQRNGRCPTVVAGAAVVQGGRGEWLRSVQGHLLGVALRFPRSGQETPGALQPVSGVSRPRGRRWWYRPPRRHGPGPRRTPACGPARSRTDSPGRRPSAWTAHAG